VRSGTAVPYLARDGLGSVSAALDGSGNVTATALYAPYGQTRYDPGTMPTAKAFTGQRADAASGLDYYGARFYDPATDQFASADAVADGLNRFAYVGDSPEARVDPTGHFANCLAMAIWRPQSAMEAVGDVGGCVGDTALAAGTADETRISTNILNVVLTQYKNSGNYKYLSPQGVAAVDDVTSHAALAKASIATLAHPSGILPGRGKSPGDIILDDVNDVTTKPGTLNTEGPGGGKLGGGDLVTGLEDAEGELKGLGTWGEAAGWLGIGLVGLVAGANDYSQHHNAARAVGVGFLHAGLSATFAWGGGAIGGMLGAAVGGPVGLVVGTFIGASVGGYLGDKTASWITDQFDNGDVATAQSDVEQGLTNLGGATVGAWNGVTSWF
jgi:RHS repeat-associated protein